MHKRYLVGSPNQTYLQALFAIIRQHAIGPEVAEIEIHLPQRSVQQVATTRHASISGRGRLRHRGSAGLQEMRVVVLQGYNLYSLISQFFDFAQVVKDYKDSPNLRRVIKFLPIYWLYHIAAFGRPDLYRASTSHIERQNLTVRMTMRCMTRLIDASARNGRI